MPVVILVAVVLMISFAIVFSSKGDGSKEALTIRDVPAVARSVLIVFILILIGLVGLSLFIKSL